MKTTQHQLSSRNAGPLREHLQIAGARIAALAARSGSGYSSDPRAYEKSCVESIPTAIMYDLIFGNAELNVAPAGLTDAELRLARTMLDVSQISYKARLNVAGQVAVRATVADFARRLAAIHTSQGALDLADVGGVAA
jgi:hypothetical protein